MTWDELLNEDISTDYSGQVLTDITCPKCGRYIYLDNTVVLTTYPVKYSYWCSCGWAGSAHVMWTGKKPEMRVEHDR